MEFTVHIPVGEITPGEFQSLPAIRAMAGALEAAGVDACYVTDHPAPSAEWLHASGHDALDPFTAFAFVAAASTTLMLHTNILVMAYRNPFLTAKALTAMAEAGVTWSMVDPPHASRQAYLENVQWFGEEVIAKLRG